MDDEPVVLDLLRMVLEEDGHDVGCAADGAEALGLFDAGEWDLLLSDFALPDTDGVHLYSRVRDALGTDAPPVLILTGDVARPDVAESLSASGLPYLVKPFDIEQLKRAITELAPPR